MGKLPFQAEFIKAPVHHSRFQQLDRWYQSAYQNLTQTYGEKLKSVFATAHLQHFLLLSPPYKSPLIGTLMASHDLSGRCYPFVLARIIHHPLAQDYPALIPLLYRQHYEIAAELCQKAHLNKEVTSFLVQFNQLEKASINSNKKEVLKEALNLFKAGRFNDCQMSERLDEEQFIGDIHKLTSLIKQYPQIGKTHGWRLPIFNKEANITGIIFWLQLLLQIMHRQGEGFYFSAFWDDISSDIAPSLKFFLNEILPQDLIFVLDPTKTESDYFMNLSQLKANSVSDRILNKFTNTTSLLSALDNFSGKDNGR